MKKCPLCAEEIQDNAIACKHCGAMFTRGGSSVGGSGNAKGGGGNVVEVTGGGLVGGQTYNTLDETIRQTGHATILAGQYRIMRKVAEGGMGVVYLAEDLEMGNREVAVKVLSPLLTRSERAIENLRSEAMLARELDHPNIIRVYGFQSNDEIKFLVMEYLDGVTLEKKLLNSSGGRLGFVETLAVLESVALALDAAHSHVPPVIHRDLKPSNVMLLHDGRVKVLDFGVAREMHDSFTMLTGASDVSGTLPYMSPEQLKGVPPIAAMDIYALAVMAYECLSGDPPFHRGDIQYQILHEQPRPVAGVTGSVNAVLQRGLAKQIEKRPKTALEFVELLKGTTSGSKVSAPAGTESVVGSGVDTDTGKISRADASKAMEQISAGGSKLKWSAVLLVLLVLVAAGAVGGWFLWGREPVDGVPIAETEPVESIEVGDGSGETALLIGLDETADADGSNQVMVVDDGVEVAADEGTGVLDDGAVGEVEEAVAAVEVAGDVEDAPAAGDYIEVLPGGIEMAMVYVEPGSFMMGISEGDREGVLPAWRRDEQPAHEVILTYGFHIGRTEVTQAQWEAVMGDNPSSNRGRDLPVEMVSWSEARDFCEALSELTGRNYCLPREAEWQYACLAGSDGRYCFGNDAAELGSYAWYVGNSGGRPNSVGIRAANAWGIYDMHGNVSEWCEDYYSIDGYGGDGGAMTNPKGVASSADQVVRGGNYSQRGNYLHAGDRIGHWPTYHSEMIGFRVVCRPVDLD